MVDRPLDIFIASASEGLEVANAVREALGRRSHLRPRVWAEGTFTPSMTFIEAIEVELNRCDFAVLTLTPDDRLESRGRTIMAPRDNVLLELGLFMGRLGRERTLRESINHARLFLDAHNQPDCRATKCNQERKVQRQCPKQAKTNRATHTSNLIRPLNTPGIVSNLVKLISFGWGITEDLILHNSIAAQAEIDAHRSGSV